MVNGVNQMVNGEWCKPNGVNPMDGVTQCSIVIWCISNMVNGVNVMVNGGWCEPNGLCKPAVVDTMDCVNPVVKTKWIV